MTMPVSHYIKDAWLNLSVRKLRSCLALLGILIGTASLVSLLLLGELAIHSVISQVEELGTNLMNVTLSSTSNSKETYWQKLNLGHIAQLKQSIPSIQTIIPIARINTKPTWHNQSLQGSVTATTSELATVAKLKLSHGRFISPLDQQSTYCVIGSDIADKLRSLGMLNPIGQQLSLDNTFVTIVGVLTPTKTRFLIPLDINHSIFTSFSNELETQHTLIISDMLVIFQKHVQPKALQAILESRLRMWRGPQERISFFSPEELIQMIQKQQRNLEILLALIGAIALVVGGIGIMNVMLVSVVERRREIGIRLAIGATPTNIRLMFLIEAITLSLTGGVLGILVSIVVTYISAYFAKWTFFLAWHPIVFGCLVALITGIFFGYYPAYHASKLQPVDALREE